MMHSVIRFISSIFIVMLLNRYVNGNSSACYQFNNLEGVVAVALNNSWKLSSVQEPDYPVPESEEGDYVWIEYLFPDHPSLTFATTENVTSSTKLSIRYHVNFFFATIYVNFIKAGDPSPRRIAEPNSSNTSNAAYWFHFNGTCTLPSGNYCCGTNASETCAGQFQLAGGVSSTLFGNKIAIDTFKINDGVCKSYATTTSVSTPHTTHTTSTALTIPTTLTTKTTLTPVSYNFIQSTTVTEKGSNDDAKNVFQKFSDILKIMGDSNTSFLGQMAGKAKGTFDFSWKLSSLPKKVKSSKSDDMADE